MQAHYPYSSLPADFQRVLLVTEALFEKANRVSLNWHRALVDREMSATMYRMGETIRLLQSVTVADVFKALAVPSQPKPQSKLSYLEHLLDFDEEEELRLNLPFQDRL